ncbi:MAG: 16S rRNA (cytosine(1402)-N(4))-methyltransferase RsmH, partial [Oscillospiraceae bacterium]
YDIVNDFDIHQITKILRDYGEENFAWQIAKNICAKRQEAPIKTTLELAEIIKMSIPAAKKREKNPCKKSFQAIRIAVNSELQSLSTGLEVAFNRLNSGGRLVVLTFHSLEDRIVKVAFNEWCRGCTCPSEFPVCICNNKPKAKLINKKPIIATKQEQEENKRSRSAKLRILEKI